MIKIITKKKWNEMIREQKMIVSGLEKERDNALKKLDAFERGKNREAVCDGYCEACAKGVRVRVTGPFAYDYFACEELIPCKMFRRKDYYARPEN